VAVGLDASRREYEQLERVPWLEWGRGGREVVAMAAVAAKGALLLLLLLFLPPPLAVVVVMFTPCSNCDEAVRVLRDDIALAESGRRGPKLRVIAASVGDNVSGTCCVGDRDGDGEAGARQLLLLPLPLRLLLPVSAKDTGPLPALAALFTAAAVQLAVPCGEGAA
jgi:hypothetical protein